MIHIVIASNQTYYIGLAATLVSLLKSNKKNFLYIHIIDGGLNNEQTGFIRNIVTSENANNKLRFHSINQNLFSGFKSDLGNSYMAYARILIPTLINEEKVIYLDSDLLVLCDILPLWETDLTNYPMAAVQDPIVKYLRNDYPYTDNCGNEKYFNTGVIVLNLNSWRKHNYQSKLLEIISVEPEKFRYWDQSAMNALFKGNVLFLEQKWNTISSNLNLKKNDPLIIHFLTKYKPWNTYNNFIELRVWRHFVKKYIFENKNLLFYLAINYKTPFVLSLLKAQIKTILGFISGIFNSKQKSTELLKTKNNIDEIDQECTNDLSLTNNLEKVSSKQIDDFIISQWG